MNKINHKLAEKLEVSKRTVVLIKRIKENEKKENEINKWLWTNCPHDFVIQEACSGDDLLKRNCSNCGLWQHETLYK
jgi:hypothetical protein